MSRHKHRRSSDASCRYHNRVAPRYDAIYDDAYWRFCDELVWRSIRPHVPQDLSCACLDLGCGTGKWGLRLLKAGLCTTFVDHSAGMIEQARRKIESLGAKSRRAKLLVADMTDLSVLGEDRFALVLAMGDPLSMCTDPVRAAREMFHVCRPGGVVIASADNKFAALSHYLERGDLNGLENLVRRARSYWLTDDPAEQFDLHLFTPASLQRLFQEAGFDVLAVLGRTVLPLRKYRHLLEDPEVRRRLLKLEWSLAEDPSSAACGSHLQIVARKPKVEPGS